MVIKRLCFACTKSGKIVRFVLKNCTFRFRDYIVCHFSHRAKSILAKVGKNFLAKVGKNLSDIIEMYYRLVR